MVFFPSRPWLSSLSLFLSLSIAASLSLFFLCLCLSLSLPVSSSLSPRCTGAIVKHWPESQALRRLRGSGLTDRWISPQAPRTGIVQEAFPSHWHPCGLRIPGFCCNNKASHAAKRKYCSKALHCFNCRCFALTYFAPYHFFPFDFFDFFSLMLSALVSQTEKVNLTVKPNLCLYYYIQHVQYGHVMHDVFIGV